MTVPTALSAVVVCLLVFAVALARATTAALAPDGDHESPDDTAIEQKRPAVSGDETGAPAPEQTKPDRPERGIGGGQRESLQTAAGRASETTNGDKETATDSVATEPENASPEWDANSDPVERSPDITSLPTSWLYGNVLVTNGLFVGVLVLAVLLTDAPVEPFGIGSTAADPGSPALAVGYGTVLGLAIAVANEASTGVLDRFGIEYDESLRRALAPSNTREWAVLLVAVLPSVALFEELLFRGAAIGVLSVGFGVSPWLLVVCSSGIFAVGHGLQGSGGVLVTGVLGLAFGVALVVTGSLLLVVVAHHVVNAAEFLRHEGPTVTGP